MKNTDKYYDFLPKHRENDENDIIFDPEDNLFNNPEGQNSLTIPGMEMKKSKNKSFSQKCKIKRYDENF